MYNLAPVFRCYNLYVILIFAVHVHWLIQPKWTACSFSVQHNV